MVAVGSVVLYKPGFEFWLYHFLALLLWTNFLTIVSLLCKASCKMELITIIQRMFCTLVCDLLLQCFQHCFGIFHFMVKPKDSLHPSRLA